jgi:hypothetical protein
MKPEAGVATISLLGVLGLVLLVESVREGRWTLPVVGVIGTVVWYLHAWWLRRQGKTPRWW